MDEVLKPCPFCGGEADYHSEKGPTGEVYGWVGCNQCDAMSCYTDTRSMQPEETHPIDAWNTRADAAPTPKADEVEAVARAVHGELSRIDVMKYLDMPDDTADRVAQAAIAAIDAAREDRVARVVEFIREQQANAHRHMLEAAHRKTASLFAAAFVTLRNLADAIERGEPFNG